jgi:hypothetical protein
MKQTIKATIIIVGSLTIVTSVFILLRINSVKDTEKSTILNTVSIIGTVITIIGLCYTAYEQVNLGIISKQIESKLSDKSFEFNIGCCIKCVDKMQTYLEDSNSLRIHERLEDLAEHLIECKKVLTAKDGIITKKGSSFTDKIEKINEYLKNVSSYREMTLSSSYSIDIFKSDGNFINTIVGMKDYLNSIKALQMKI